MDRVEAERKYRCAHDPVRRALADAGFRRRGAVEQVDRYFDHPLRSFGVTDEALRVRSETDADGGDRRCELTYKGPRLGGGAKSRRELTVTVPAGEPIEALLRALEFAPVATVTKARERFERDGVVVSLDRVDGLGAFVEVEVLTTRTGVDAATAEVEDVARELALDGADPVGETYLELHLADASE